MQTARNTAGKAIQPKRTTSPKKDKMTMCPAIMFAKSRIIKAALRTTILANSTTKKNGTSHGGSVEGTSARHIPLSPLRARVPKTSRTKIKKARENVTLILDVAVEKIGTSPRRLRVKIKKKMVHNIGVN